MILVGRITGNALNKFLKEFYHPDHQMKEEVRILIIMNSEPPKDIRAVLENPKYSENL